MNSGDEGKRGTECLSLALVLFLRPIALFDLKAAPTRTITLRFLRKDTKEESLCVYSKAWDSFLSPQMPSQGSPPEIDCEDVKLTHAQEAIPSSVSSHFKSSSGAYFACTKYLIHDRAVRA